MAQLWAMRMLVSALLLACAVPVAAQSVAVATTSGGTGRSSLSVTAAFGQTVRINQLALRPIAIVQDSRCPANANCVWAGQLIVDFRTGRRGSIRLEQGKPLAVAGGRLTLVGATPQAIAGRKIPPQAYRFQLRFERP
jgi:hypothetical protein